MKNSFSKVTNPQLNGLTNIPSKKFFFEGKIKRTDNDIPWKHKFSEGNNLTEVVYCRTATKFVHKMLRDFFVTVNNTTQ